MKADQSLIRHSLMLILLLVQVACGPGEPSPRRRAIAAAKEHCDDKDMQSVRKQIVEHTELDGQQVYVTRVWYTLTLSSKEIFAIFSSLPH